MGEKVERGVKSSFEKASAAWIDYKNQIRFYDLCSKLFQQDNNLEEALKEIDELKSFIADPNHILGSELTKHGEIAEHVQVNISNARKAIEGFEKEYTFEGVGRTARDDYVKNGLPVMCSPCQGQSNFRLLSSHEKWCNL